MNKKIITIAEIVFALIFVVMLAVFMATINNKGNSANTQLVETLDMTDSTSAQKYNNTQVKGTEVQNACINYKTLSGSLKVEVDVKLLEPNDAGEKDGDYVIYRYGYAQVNSTKGWDGGNYNKGSDMGGYTQPTSNDPRYINPSADFRAELVTNSNNVLTHVVFTQIDTKKAS